MTLRTFEECYPEVEAIVEKQRAQWTFKATMMRDFDDVKMEIIAHIWKKWSLYDQARPLGGWVATIVKHQFWNILRDTYLSTSAPCSRCPSNLGENLCALFGEQGVDCAIYKKWYNNKRHSHQARLPLALENHANEAYSRPDQSSDLEGAIGGLHDKMKDVLTKSEWEIYRRLFIEHKSEEEVAQELGFKTTEKGRKMGYKRIRQVKTLILKKAKGLIGEHGIEGFK